MEDNFEQEDPIELIYTMLVKGEKKEDALLITNAIIDILQNPEIQAESKVAISHIFTSIYVWNDDYINAKRYQKYFLNDDEFCSKFKNEIVSYLILVFAKNNDEFIKNLLLEYPFIKSDFNDIYKAYLSSIVDPNSEEHYSLDLLREYNLLLQAKRLYVDE